MRKSYGKSAVEQIKEIFFLKPTMTIHLRALARAVDFSAPATKKAADRLVREGFLSKRRTPPTVSYAALHETHGFRAEKRLWNLGQLDKSGIVERIAQQTAPEAIILFGSYAKGEDWEQSDIDLALIKPRAKADVTGIATPRPVQLFTVSGKPERMLANNLVNGIVLYGRWGPL